MSIDYQLRVSPVLSAAEALNRVEEAFGCDRRYVDPDAVAREDLRVTAWRDTAEEDPEMAELLGGVDEILVVIFHPSKFISDEQDARIFAEMLDFASKLMEDFPDAKGTFTFQNEIIYLQRLGNEVIMLDGRLRLPDHNRYGSLDNLLAKYPVREIDQVFL